MSNPKPLWPYWLAVVACVAGVVLYSRNDIGPLLQELTSKQPAPVAVEPEKSGPRYPLEPGAQATQPAYDTEIKPLPPLAESDSYIRTLLNEIFGSDVDGVLIGNDLIGKFVATIDSLTAAKPARKTWPVAMRMDAFKAVAADDGSGEFVMSPDNYVRFDFLVNLFTSPAPATLAATYRRLYPLVQEAYTGLGYPDGYFNDRLIEVIDHLLSTPKPAEPIRLVQPRVFYQFADPQLEALSGGQKLLLRMGSTNAAKLRKLLQELRQELTKADNRSSAMPAAPVQTAE
jgi:hypothetical protein